MLNEEEIRALIVMRFIAAVKSCNSFHRNHCAGQIRGLVAALTGETPPSLHEIPDVLDAAGIPYTLNGDDTWSWDKDWLKDHGFTFDPDDEDSLDHPKFEDW